jgi:ABC-type cobalt transport system substrate-binding protein
LKKIFYKITHWEAWPFKLLYAPIGIVWVWYIIKAKAVWFFTPSNPKLTFGGMEGEPKKEMYDLLPPELYPPTFNVLPKQPFNEIESLLQQHKIIYPLIVKPEVGGQGILLRKIDNKEEFLHYHAKMPYEYIVQQMVYYPMEVSVFYIRHPKEQKGIVTGFLHKIPLCVIGNGVQTLEQLIHHHSKAKKRIGELHSKHKEKWNDVLPKGEKYMLSYAANHNRGAQFIDLKNEIDEQLVSIFDKISLQINDFFYGRYDIMCESVNDLKVEKNFTILEYNGCGAEPNHFYDTGYTLMGAYKEILKHWKLLYEISMYNKKQGIQPWSVKKGRQFLTATRKLYTAMKEVDKTIEL